MQTDLKYSTKESKQFIGIQRGAARWGQRVGGGGCLSAGREIDVLVINNYGGIEIDWTSACRAVLEIFNSEGSKALQTYSMAALKTCFHTLCVADAAEDIFLCQIINQLVAVQYGLRYSFLMFDNTIKFLLLLLYSTPFFDELGDEGRQLIPKLHWQGDLLRAGRARCLVGRALSCRGMRPCLLYTSPSPRD